MYHAVPSGAVLSQRIPITENQYPLNLNWHVAGGYFGEKYVHNGNWRRRILLRHNQNR